MLFVQDVENVLRLALFTVSTKEASSAQHIKIKSFIEFKSTGYERIPWIENKKGVRYGR